MATSPQPLSNVEVFDFKKLRRRYEKFTACATAECVLSTDLVGGISADRKGIEMFVRHQMRVAETMPDQTEEAVEAEIQATVNRILKEEIGERGIEQANGDETGELDEKLTYGVNVIRRDEHGPFLGNWMVKACLKASASRLGLWMKKRGSKGDMAEMGEVQAHGISLIGDSDRIYLRSNADANRPAPTEFQQFKGRVQTPQGSKSIIHDSEVVPAGARFSFQYRFGTSKLAKADIPDIFALAMVVGLGSVKAMERGKFRIERLEVSVPQ